MRFSFSLGSCMHAALIVVYNYRWRILQNHRYCLRLVLYYLKYSSTGFTAFTYFITCFTAFPFFFVSSVLDWWKFLISHSTNFPPFKGSASHVPAFLIQWGGKGCVCVFVLPNSHLPLAAMYNSILGILVATKFNLLNPMDTASRLWNYLPTRPDWCLQNLPHRLVQRNVHPL